MAQMGAYDRLLDFYYESEQPLPSDLEECYMIAGARSEQDKADVEKVLGKFFLLADAGYTQERTEHEIAYAKPKIEAARTNGARGGRPKKTQEKPSGFPEETHDEPKSKAPQPHSNTSSPTSKKYRAQERACPDGVDAQVWSDWLALRKAKRAPVSDTVLTSAMVEAERAGMSLEAFLRVWCARGSQGLEASWLKPSERPPPPSETAYQRSMRERIESFAPGIAAKAPGRQSTFVMEAPFDDIKRIA